MALPNADDVADGFRARWAAVASLAAAIPADRVYRGRTAERTEYPNARLVIVEGDRRHFSDGRYVQSFAVSVEAFSAATPADAEPIRQKLDAAFAGTKADPTSGLTVSGATVLHCKGVAGGGSEPTQVRQANVEIVKTTARFEVLVSGDRG